MQLNVILMIGGDFLFGKWVELLEEHDGGAGVFSFFSFGLELVADFSGADQDAVGLSDFGVGDDVEEILVGEIFNRRAGVGVAQHALWREDHERLAPVARGLAAQEMEILRGVGRLRDLDVVFGG